MTQFQQMEQTQLDKLLTHRNKGYSDTLQKTICPEVQNDLLTTSMASRYTDWFNLAFDRYRKPRTYEKQREIVDCYLERIEEYPYTSVREVLEYLEYDEWRHNYQYDYVFQLHRSLKNRFPKTLRQSGCFISDVSEFLDFFTKKPRHEMATLCVMQKLLDTSAKALCQLRIDPANWHPLSGMYLFAESLLQHSMSLSEHRDILMDRQYDTEGYDTELDRMIDRPVGTLYSLRCELKCVLQRMLRPLIELD